MSEQAFRIAVKQSGPMQLLSLVWEHKQAATSHSWLKINHAMSDALTLAIRSGMEFAINDFAEMSQFRPGYWRNIENNYQDAVLYRNSSAWKSIEALLKRVPFIVKGASMRAYTGDGPCGEGLARLIVGAEFKWDGSHVHVTSINDAKGYVVACVYGDWDGDEDLCPTCKRARKSREYKVTKQYKITHADIKAAKKAANA